MARVDFTVRQWTGDHQTEADEEPGGLLADPEMLIDGEPAFNCRLEADGFVEVHIHSPSPEMRARYGPDQTLEGTNDSELVLPVTELLVHVEGPA